MPRASAFLLAVLLLTPTAAAWAEGQGSWRVIGQTQASHKADHDEIVVSGPDDKFRRIKLKVKDAPLNLERLVVTYGNGAKYDVLVRQMIPQGGESRVVELRAAGSIRKIEFWYDTKGSGHGKADVTVVGMR